MLFLNDEHVSVIKRETTELEDEGLTIFLFFLIAIAHLISFFLVGTNYTLSM